jgi:hypothetical protein
MKKLWPCRWDKLAPGLWDGIALLNEMIDYADEGNKPVGPRALRKNPAWRNFLYENVMQAAPGVYAVRYLNPLFCQQMLNSFELLQYAVNEEEPVSAQIPELILFDKDHELHECLRGLYAAYMAKLVQVLYGVEVGDCMSIQAARYKPHNTPHGCWHLDDDSEVTLVVALSNSHAGGGTAVYQGPFMEPAVVPQLSPGWGMLFNGRSRLHMGLPVLEGTRNLLVHWYNQTKDSE